MTIYQGDVQISFRTGRVLGISKLVMNSFLDGPRPNYKSPISYMEIVLQSRKLTLQGFAKSLHSFACGRSTFYDHTNACHLFLGSINNPF